MRVLIVEDNKPFAALVAQYLQRAGFESDRAESLEEAEHATSTMTYSAIVLDLGLRDGDGMELLRMFRQRGDSTPIVIITARHGLEDRVRGLREGAGDYLAKPFSIDELVARLHAVMRRPGKLLNQVLRAGNITLNTSRWC
ncbi:MAG: response regulator [Proteobacteria bacterium]|nr:response regulator [Pseudomonadota bacterium]